MGGQQVGCEGSIWRSKYAYVFVLYGPTCAEYFLGIATVAWSLMKHLCTHMRVLVYTPDVPKHLLKIAKTSGAFDEIVEKEYIEASERFFSNPQSHIRFGKIFTKYRVLELEQYEKVLMLDADLHVRANLDHLFNLQAPAAMARGPNKPPEGTRLQRKQPINAGVMLLQPSRPHLLAMLENITGPNPQTPSHHNSPDADYLTEVFKDYVGKWASIPLEYNFQLEYEHLDAGKGIIRFSQQREAHFSDEGAETNFEDLKVLHFSGAKPWSNLLDDGAPLQRLRAEGGSQKGLGEKLVQGIREYAQAVAAFQGLCSQLQLGEGVLWREFDERRRLPLSSTAARAQLHAQLTRFEKPGGRWFEGFRLRSAVWIPPGEGQPTTDAGLPRSEPVGAFLEISSSAATTAALGVGDMVTVQGSEFKIVAMMQPGMATVQRQVILPPNWRKEKDPNSSQDYYCKIGSKESQWEFPNLPRDWGAAWNHERNCVYYINTRTQHTRWNPPEIEEFDIPVKDLEVSSISPNRTEHCDVTIWRRCFSQDRVSHEVMRKAVDEVCKLKGC